MFNIYISIYLLYICTHRYKSIMPTDQCHLNPRQHQRVGFLAAGEAGSSDRGGQPLPPRGCYNGQHKKTWKNGETRLEHDLLIYWWVFYICSYFFFPQGDFTDGDFKWRCSVCNQWCSVASPLINYRNGMMNPPTNLFIRAVPGTWVIGTSTGFTQNDGSLLMWLDFIIFYL